jgi:hypothetical protein
VSLVSCASPPGLPNQSETPDPKFSVVETAYATVRSEPGVNDSDSRQVGLFFEIGYGIVGEDLGYAAKRPQLYVYLSEQRMYQDLIQRWHYPEWVRKVHTIPRMHHDYIEWIPPKQHQDIAFITHEYSHRIIEQIAGVNSQVKFKWFDEGLAEYEGQKALAKPFPASAESQKETRLRMLANASASHTLIPLSRIATEMQWAAQIERGSQLAYIEAWGAVDYLISQHGVVEVIKVLTQIGTGKRFAEAFQETYGFSVDQFEASFRMSLLDY